MSFRNIAVATLLAIAAIVEIASAAVGSGTVSSTILVLARDGDSSYSATSGFDAYGIPYQLVLVPQGGTALPALNATATSGNYGGIILLSDVSYDYDGSYQSALSQDQFNALYAYQVAFGVRMVRLDVYPDSTSGTDVVTASDGSSGCCADDVEQLMSFTNTTGFPTANLKSGATVSTKNLYHYPAKITDSKTTWKVAQFATSGNFKLSSIAAVVNNFKGREQMAFFIGFATEWSATSNYLQHAYIHWITRGLFVGARKVYLGTQIDDMHLTTAMYYPSGKLYRVVPADISAHVSWMASVNSRLPAGSNYFVEIGHNGNGDIINATNTGYGLSSDPCVPVDAIYYTAPVESTELEYMKPVGSGVDVWPQTPANYSWSLACCRLDKLATWFMTPANRDAFAHISHTFTHLNLNKATYDDASKEIFFNQAWLKQVGIDAGKFSPAGLIPPAITGMHNGDVLKAWLDNGIKTFLDREARDACSPSMTYSYSADGKTITGATVHTANGNTCSVPVPVTFPGTASGSARSDSVGSEPLIMWASMQGQPVTFSLGAAVAVL